MTIPWTHEWTCAWPLAIVIALACIVPHVTAQITSAGAQQPREIVASASLPEDPSALLNLPSAPFSAAGQDTSLLKPARKNHRVVRPYESAPPLSAGGKLRLSIVSRLSLGEAGATLFAAGWSQLTNGRPHTGTDSGAFGERLRDLAIKQTSQSFFTYGVFAAAFHDDPRYYVLGDKKPILRRAVTSALGVVIARKDDGSSAINWPRFTGIAAATALANAYYPSDDRGFAKSADAFASSLGSAVLNNELHEFSGDLVHLLPRRHHH
ncbi:MAG TPA: hypothetical protein VHY48_11515 [Acidobacteriaceae bacterium]|nr:hypothetical protein [Acidobacteriaceae bacterium]